VEAVIDIKGTFTQNPPNWGTTRGPNGGLTNEEALNVVQHCETFKILGLSAASGASAVSTSFLLDDLRWLDRDSIIIAASADSLRKYAANTHLYIGSHVEYDDLFNVTDAKESQVIAQEFNLLQPGAALHWFLFEPSEGVFDFVQTDAMVNYAISNHMAVYSYGLWHAQMPAWLRDKSFAELGPILTNYIDTVGRRYQGKIAIWNVFNEVVNDDGTGFRNRSPDHQFGDNIYSPFVEGSDTSLIKSALREAHISDPNAILILNDFDTDFFYNFVSGLVKEGIPIDGVGFELHLFYKKNSNLEWVSDLPGYLSKVDETIKRYSALGLKVVLGEVENPIFMKDIDTTTADGQAELKRRIDYQAQIYGGLMKVALDNPNVIAFSTQDMTDRYSWVYNPDPYGNPRVGFPDLFYKDYQPKPAYYEVLNALMNWR
jgi:endo-1,4-beta-xylanase